MLLQQDAQIAVQFTCAVYIARRATSRGGEEQNFLLSNAVGLCRAAGELPARETIRRKEEMERESN